ncbi:MAG: Gx transporter family protein, partial [Treponemataceae bacterium]
MTFFSKKNINTHLISTLGALCFFLSTIEYVIPKPVPFFRLGLANLPLLLAVEILCLPEFLILVLIKIVGQNLLAGTLFSYVFLLSAIGTLGSALAMVILV